MYEFKGIKFIVKGELLPSLKFFAERPANVVRLFNSDKLVVWVNCIFMNYARFESSHHILELRAPDGGGFSRSEAESLAEEMVCHSKGIYPLFDKYKPTYRYLTTQDLSQPV